MLPPDLLRASPPPACDAPGVRRHRVALALAGLALTGLACATLPRAAPGPRFSGERALDLLARLLADSPRALGDPRRDAAIDALADDLKRRGAATVEPLDHEGVDPWTGRTYRLRTLIADVRPAAPHRFVLATHFDTRPWAEEDPDPARRDAPIPGANDGTSGLAVALTLIPLLVDQLPAEHGFSVILFDGEELGRPPAEGYLLGSRALASALAAGRFPRVAAARYAIILDMVGDADLRFVVDPASRDAAPWLLDALWREAAAAGFTDAFPAEALIRPIIDDHRPLIDAGLPAVVLLDPDYPPWHTHADALDRVSARSLEATGETVRRAILALARDASPRG